MSPLIVAIITAITTILASSGFWAYMQKRAEKKSSSNKMLLGLGHDRILELGMRYIQRGSVTKDELENLVDYLYAPYKEMGGNGTAERVIMEVQKLQITEYPQTWPIVDRRKNHENEQ